MSADTVHHQEVDGARHVLIDLNGPARFDVHDLFHASFEIGRALRKSRPRDDGPDDRLVVGEIPHDAVTRFGDRRQISLARRIELDRLVQRLAADDLFEVLGDCLLGESIALCEQPARRIVPTDFQPASSGNNSSRRPADARGTLVDSNRNGLLANRERCFTSQVIRDVPEAISELLRSAVDRGDVPVVVGAVASGEDLVYLEAFGKRDVAANADAGPDAIFRIASMTKPVTSLAVLMLADEGRIALDDPITKHLPDYRQPPVVTTRNADGTYESRPANRAITIRDLLTHTSGLAYPFFDPLLSRLTAEGGGAMELPLLHDPGVKWTYGPSTALVGRMVAQVSGQSQDAFCHERIFEPLGMVDTAYAVPDAKRDRVVTQHHRDAGGQLVERPNPATIQSKGRGDDGLFSTASDYAAFLALFLNEGRHRGRQLVKAETIHDAVTNQIGSLVVRSHAALDPSIARPFPLGAGRDTFGFGFQIKSAPSEDGTRRPGSFGWSGIFNTYFWGDPEENIAAVLLMQQLPANDEHVTTLLRGFERLIYRGRV